MVVLALVNVTVPSATVAVAETVVPVALLKLTQMSALFTVPCAAVAVVSIAQLELQLIERLGVVCSRIRNLEFMWDMVIIHVFMSHSHLLLQVHALRSVCCMVFGLLVCWGLLWLLRGVLLVCLPHVLGLVLKLLLLHVGMSL